MISDIRMNSIGNPQSIVAYSSQESTDGGSVLGNGITITVGAEEVCE